MTYLEVDGDICLASGGTFAAPATLTPIDNIESCSIDSQYDKANASTRGSRFKKWKSAMRDVPVTGKILKEASDTSFAALRDAHNNRTTVHLILLDGPYNSVGAEGINADWEVIKFARSGDIEGLVVYDFELCLAKTANEPTWFTVSA